MLILMMKALKNVSKRRLALYLSMLLDTHAGHVANDLVKNLICKCMNEFTLAPNLTSVIIARNLFPISATLMIMSDVI